MKNIVVNTRCLLRTLTGVQRYTQEIVSRLPLDIERLSPQKTIGQLYGHVWEQFILPSKLKGRLLWSPANSGPIFYKNQVVTIHDMNVFDYPQFFGSKRFVLWYQYMLQKLIKNTLHIITVSNYSADRIQQISKIPANKISVIYPGVSNYFTPLDIDQILQKLQNLKLPTTKYILSLSSVAPNKNFNNLISAWEKISSEVPEDVWLFIVGGYPKLAPAFQFDNLPKRVHFLGYVNEQYLPYLYAGALLFAFLSLNEGFGLPALEAMACGSPVIVANAGALPEVVGDDECLVDPSSVAETSQRIKLLLKNDSMRASMKLKSIARAKTFSWDKTTDDIVKTLRSFT